MSETEQSPQLRSALLQTTGTVGWTYIKEIADRIVKQVTQEALDEESPVLGESKRLKAKALQRGFKDFFGAIETGKAFDTNDDSEWIAHLNDFQEPQNGR